MTVLRCVRSGTSWRDRQSAVMDTAGTLMPTHGSSVRTGISFLLSQSYVHTVTISFYTLLYSFAEPTEEYISAFNQLGRSQWPCGLRRRSAAARVLRSWVRIPPEAWMSVCCECYVSSGRGLCDEMITRPEESYRLWYVFVCDHETSLMRRPWPALARSATGGGTWCTCACFEHMCSKHVEAWNKTYRETNFVHQVG